MEQKKRIRLKVASPCSADWNSMKGDDAVRFCGLCEKNVYQLSNMSSEQIEALLAESGEKKCVRFYQRKDGTLLTDNCSVGLARRRGKTALASLSMSALAVLGLSLGGGSPVAADQDGTAETSAQTPTPEAVEPLEVIEPPSHTDPEPYEVMMGGIAEYDVEDIEPVDVEPID